MSQSFLNVLWRYCPCFRSPIAPCPVWSYLSRSPCVRRACVPVCPSAYRARWTCCVRSRLRWDQSQWRSRARTPSLHSPRCVCFACTRPSPRPTRVHSSPTRWPTSHQRTWVPILRGCSSGYVYTRRSLDPFKLVKYCFLEPAAVLSLYRFRPYPDRVVERAAR